MTVVPDFKYEAQLAAVNEACGSSPEAAHCTIQSLCPFCNALANSIEIRLREAFRKGQQSMMPIANRLPLEEGTKPGLGG